MARLDKQSDTLLWVSKSNLSAEYSKFTIADDRIVFMGTVVMLLERVPTLVTYTIGCDSKWIVREAHVQQEQSGMTRRLNLKVDEKQVWHKNQAIVPFATGLFDVDLEISPATNTLPIRRLGLKVGQSAEVKAVWVRFPSLKIEPLGQRYTRVSDRCYLYETPSTGYRAQLEVDESGFIKKYDRLWRRLP